MIFCILKVGYIYMMYLKSGLHLYSVFRILVMYNVSLLKRVLPLRTFTLQLSRHSNVILRRKRPKYNEGG